MRYRLLSIQMQKDSTNTPDLIRRQLVFRRVCVCVCAAALALCVAWARLFDHRAVPSRSPRLRQHGRARFFCWRMDGWNCGRVVGCMLGKSVWLVSFLSILLILHHLSYKLNLLFTPSDPLSFSQCSVFYCRRAGDGWRMRTYDELLFWLFIFISCLAVVFLGSWNESVQRPYRTPRMSHIDTASGSISWFKLTKVGNERTWS